MTSHPLELYGASGCPYTADLREHLALDGREFVEYDVEADPAARARLLALTGESRVPALIEEGRPVRVGWGGRSCLV